MPVTQPSAIEVARAAAARHLRDAGFPTEAESVEAGLGDDFAEVRIALSLWSILTGQRATPRPAPTRFSRRSAGEEC